MITDLCKVQVRVVDAARAKAARVDQFHNYTEANWFDLAYAVGGATYTATRPEVDDYIARTRRSDRGIGIECRLMPLETTSADTGIDLSRYRSITAPEVQAESGLVVSCTE